jgi:nucleotide-binding universal stress UspA family protein
VRIRHTGARRRTVAHARARGGGGAGRFGRSVLSLFFFTKTATPSKFGGLRYDADRIGTRLAFLMIGPRRQERRGAGNRKEPAMKLNKILYPCDFSAAGQAALETAAALARDHGAKLLVLHVQEPVVAYGGGELYSGIPEVDVDALRRQLLEVAPADRRVAVEHRLLVGSPAAAIVRTAEEEKVDMIVMSTHGRTGLMRVLMGSVAEEVVRKAKCPVVTVKGTAAVAEPAAA